jgi:simple sugar transport system substrate-binding protein
MALKKLLRIRHFAVLAGLLTTLCIQPLAAQSNASAGPAQSSQPLDVAFVYVTPVLPVGWTAQHDAGRKQMEAALAGKVKTRFVDNVPEGADAERVLRDLAQSGAKLIFATSFGYGAAVHKVAKEFPGVKFEHITGYQSAPNVGFANARYYEGRYLAGMLAGGMSKSNVIGYVAGFPIPEVLQGINAFARGARELNPKATVHVLWTHSWFDPPKEAEAAGALINSKGADVLTYHLGSPAVARAAEGAGKWLIAYHSDMRGIAPKSQLASVTHHWGEYYTSSALSATRNSWKHSGVWGGLKEGMVKLEFVSDAVPEALRQRVQARRDAIAAGKWHPFAAPVIDAQGKVVLASGTLSDAELGRMNFLAEGVVGTLDMAK